MKLATKKIISFFIFCFVVCFILISIFGVHSRWGNTINNHFKGFQNLSFSNDFNNYTEIKLRAENNTVDLFDKQIVNTLKNRLHYLNLNDNEILVDEQNKEIIVQCSQPAGEPELNAVTFVDVVATKGDFSIETTHAKKSDRALALNKNDVDFAELIIKSPTDEKTPTNLTEKTTYGLRLNLNSKGAEKLTNLTNKIIADNGKMNKNKKLQKNPNALKQLVLKFDNSVFTFINVTEPIANGKIELFNQTLPNNNQNMMGYSPAFTTKPLTSFVIKKLIATINTPSLPSFFDVKSLYRLSPGLGMWFKRCCAIVLFFVLMAIGLILILKSKLVGLICAVCLLGHFCFMLACFTGFFKIYPGVIFNFEALVGCVVSGLIGVLTCFLLVQRIQNHFKINQNQFNNAIKIGLNQTQSYSFILNLKIVLLSIILMALFSNETNTISFLLKPVFDLFNFKIISNEKIASLAYALFVGSVGSLIFENYVIKIIMSPVTAPTINLNNVKQFFQQLKIELKNKPTKTNKTLKLK